MRALPLLPVMVLGTAAYVFAAQPIKLGVHPPLTGQNAFGGQLEPEGVQLAHKEKTTVPGRPVELGIVDNTPDVGLVRPASGSIIHKG